MSAFSAPPALADAAVEPVAVESCSAGLRPDEVCASDWANEIGAGREVSVGDDIRFSIAVIDHGPYTTTLRISQCTEKGAAGIGGLLAPRLTVRVYHDARLAEVVGFCERRRVWPRYDYPNSEMLQPDEKAQWNRFLGDWLSLCLHHGWTREQRLPVM